MESQTLLSLLPIDASLAGKGEADRNQFLQQFAQLPLAVRRFMSSPDTARAIASLIEKGIIPQSHGVAVARLIAFVALGHVTQEQIPVLLERIGLSNTAAVSDELSGGVLKLLEKARKEPLLAPKPVAPLAVRRPMVGPPPRPPAIIDLRKQQP